MANLAVKPNLILLHGWAFNSAVWQPNRDFLEAHYQVTALDLNGHGNNAFNPEYKQLDFYLEHLIAQIPDNSNILGWSLGGNIALNLKHKYPTKINKIVLCCSNPCFLAHQNWAHGVDSNVLNKFSNNLLTSPDKTIKEFLLLQTMHHPDSKNLYKSLLQLINNSPTPSIDGLQWGLDILKQDYLSLLNTIDHQDIKFILGEKDALVPRFLANHLSDAYKDIDVTILKKSGHIPFATEPTSFHEILINNLK